MTTGERRDQIRGRELRQTEVTGLLTGQITPAMFHTSVFGGVPTAIDPDDAGAAGVATTLSRSDHAHEFLTASASGLTRTATSSEGSSGDGARADHVHATNLLPWGAIFQQIETTDDGPHSADADTDMVCNNLSVIQGRLYGFHLHTRSLIGSLDVNSRWIIRLRLNGADIAVFDDMEPRVGGSTRRIIDSMVTWEAPTTQATDDFLVRADEAAGDSALTLEATATSPRTFTVYDLGEAP